MSERQDRGWDRSADRSDVGSAATGGGASAGAGIAAAVCVRVEEFVLDAALSVRRGELLALTGPNGGGKTTLLRALAGLAPLERGRITLENRAVDDPEEGIWIPPERRGIGYAFQDVRLFPHLSVLENVEFGLLHRTHRTWPRTGETHRTDRHSEADRHGEADRRGEAKRRDREGEAKRRDREGDIVGRDREGDRRGEADRHGVFHSTRRRNVRTAALAALESVRMAERASDRPDSLSGGQAQRVSLARALAARPPVLLLDEPFSAVDAAVKPELLRLVAAAGATVVIASHDPDALKSADRVMTLLSGHISKD